MTGISLSLLFAGLSASIAWHTGKRAWAYLKMGRDFMGTTSTQDTGRSLLFAGTLWGAGAIALVAATLFLIGLAVFYALLLF